MNIIIFKVTMTILSCSFQWKGKKKKMFKLFQMLSASDSKSTQDICTQKQLR